MLARHLATWMALSPLPACGAIATFEDEGTLCVVGTALLDSEDGEGPRTTTYEAGAPVTINVVLEECANGCAEDVEASCSIEMDGNTLRVSASGSYREPGSGSCIDVCVVVDAQCESEPLPAGSYTVEYAGESVGFDVPDERVPATIGQAFCEPSPT